MTDQEPSQEELCELETELDEVNDTGEVEDEDDLLDELDLDLLLSESVAMNEKRKAANRKTGNYANDLPPLNIPVGPCWKTISSHAIFAQHECACGTQTRTFSHFAELQTYTAIADGKPKRWTKVYSKPKVLGESYLIAVSVPFCMSCLEHSSPMKQLHKAEPRKGLIELTLNLELKDGTSEEHH